MIVATACACWWGENFSERAAEAPEELRNDERAVAKYPAIN
jgi:hypothetical protein